MKKIIPLLAGIMASGAASAAFTLNSGNNNYRMTDCGLLANDIVITLSQNVVGGVQCDDANNFIAISVCHTSGLVSERSSVVTKDATGAVTCTVTATEDCVQTVTGSAFPTATTADGTVGSQFPGNTCDATNVEAQADAQTAP